MPSRAGRPICCFSLHRLWRWPLPKGVTIHPTHESPIQRGRVLRELSTM